MATHADVGTVAWGPGRAWRPVLMLMLVSPLLLEFLSGDVTLSAAPALIGFACLNGAGAVLIRELAVRRGSSATLLLGAVAFGVWEEGVLDQSLFDPNGLAPGWLSYGYLPALGTSPPMVVFELTIDAVFSVLVPVALTELAFPRHRPQPWLGTRGLGVVGVLFGLGSAATAAMTAARGRWPVAWPELLVALAVMAALLAAAVLTRPVEPASPRPGGFRRADPAPRPWPTAALTLVSSSALMLLVHTRNELGVPPWAMTTLLMALAGATAVALLSWRRRSGWTPTHQFAACAGAVMTYAWFGLFRRLTDTPIHATEQIALVAATAVAMIVLHHQLRTARTAVPAASAS